MKSLKKLSLGLLVTAALTGSALAAGTTTPTIIRVVGSTAFRPGCTASIVDYLATLPDSNGVTGKVYAGFQGKTILLTSAEAIIANGTLSTSTTPGSATFIVETFWTGSLAGTVDVAVGNTTGDTFMDNNNGAGGTNSSTGSLTDTQIGEINGAATVSSTNQYGGTQQNNTATAGYFFSGTSPDNVSLATLVPNMAMSDTDLGSISSELFTADPQFYTSSGGTLASLGGYANPQALANALGSVLQNAGLSTDTSGGATNAVNSGYVGVIPFIWLTQTGSSVTNMSQQTAAALMTTGYVAQAAFTGSDTTDYYYLVGRNEDSGTRITALSEAQFGVSNNPIEYAYPNIAITGTTTPTKAEKFPIVALNTETAIKWTLSGHSGYASGGNVASVVSTTPLTVASGTTTFANGKATGNAVGSKAWFVGYIGIADALGATGTPVVLNYGGVPYGVSAIENGQYTFWGYEHCFRLQGASTAVASFIDNLADQIYDFDADISGYVGGHDNGTTTVQLGGSGPSLATASGILASKMVVKRQSTGGPINY